MNRDQLISALETVNERRAVKRREDAEAAAFVIGLTMIFVGVGHMIVGAWRRFARDRREENFAAAAKASARHLVLVDGDASKITVPGRRYEAPSTALRVALRTRGLGELHISEVDHGTHTIFRLRHRTAYAPELQPIADQFVNDSLETERVWQAHLLEMARLNRERPNTKRLPKHRAIGTYA